MFWCGVLLQDTPCVFVAIQKETPRNTNISILRTARAKHKRNRQEPRVCRVVSWNYRMFFGIPPALVGRAKVWLEVRQILAGPIWIDILPVHIQMWTMTFICLCCICSFLFMIHTNGMTNFMNHTSHSSHIFAPAQVDFTVVRRASPQILQVRSFDTHFFFWKNNQNKKTFVQFLQHVKIHHSCYWKFPLNHSNHLGHEKIIPA